MHWADSPKSDRAVSRAAEMRATPGAGSPVPVSSTTSRPGAASGWTASRWTLQRSFETVPMTKLAHSVGRSSSTRASPRALRTASGMNVMSGAVAPNAWARAPSRTTVPGPDGAVRSLAGVRICPPASVSTVRGGAAEAATSAAVTRARSQDDVPAVPARTSTRSPTRAPSATPSTSRLAVPFATCGRTSARSGARAFHAARASSPVSVSKVTGWASCSGIEATARPLGTVTTSGTPG